MLVLFKRVKRLYLCAERTKTGWASNLEVEFFFFLGFLALMSVPKDEGEHWSLLKRKQEEYLREDRGWRYSPLNMLKR